MAGGLSDWEELKQLLRELNTNINDFNRSSTRYSWVTLPEEVDSFIADFK